MSTIADFLARRKAIKMGTSPSASSVGRQTQAQARYAQNDHFSKNPDFEDRALGRDDAFRVSDNRFAR